MQDFHTKQRREMINRILMEEKIYTRSEMIESEIKTFLSGLAVGASMAFIICAFFIGR